MRRAAHSTLAACFFDTGSCCGCRVLTRNALGLAISPHVDFELHEDRQHSEEGVTCRCRGIDALIESAQIGVSFLDLVGDVSQRPAEPIKLRG